MSDRQTVACAYCATEVQMEAPPGRALYHDWIDGRAEELHSCDLRVVRSRILAARGTPELTIRAYVMGAFAMWTDDAAKKLCATIAEHPRSVNRSEDGRPLAELDALDRQVRGALSTFHNKACDDCLALAQVGDACEKHTPIYDALNTLLATARAGLEGCTREWGECAGTKHRCRSPHARHTYHVCAECGDIATVTAINDAARGVGSTPSETPEALAQRFHEIYERLAPDFGYETRKDSAKPWSEVPEKNRRLMTAVCAEILGTLRSGRGANDG